MATKSHNTDKKKIDLLVFYFSYDFRVTVIRHQNADVAMVVTNALMRGIRPATDISEL
jgi:hypothetical protein